MEKLLYILIVYIVPLTVAILLYIFFGKILKGVVSDILKDNSECNKHKITSRCVAQYYIIKENELLFVSKWFWPIVLAFLMGCYFGEKCYTLYTRDSDENRLAAWFF